MSDLSHPAPRRTQTERSEQTRQRLIEAVIKSLQTYGYAGTTVTQIVTLANVSRGALLHHFATKAELIEAAAQYLVKAIYKQFNHSVQKLSPSENSLDDFIFTAWQVITAQPESIAFAELLLESQRDQKLADILQRLWTNVYISLEEFARAHLEPIATASEVKQLMVLTQWMLRGIALDKHLITDQGLINHYIKLWSNLLSQHIHTRNG
ncbi:TetR/AcrR family transcriptional regulator [Alkanindiges sp. WGS2144]|uniref:TetR/AcrR family transcriptional regulator n=1 Tax=Alkanindiges sp. WGS2144 TaxID=3366808 RepID=UPI0037530E39